MVFYDITEEDMELIEIALSKIGRCFDSEKYNHTVKGNGAYHAIRSAFLFVVGTAHGGAPGRAVPVDQHRQPAGIAAGSPQVIDAGLLIHIDGHVIVG